MAVGSINVMVNLISQNFEDNDCMGVLKNMKKVVISAKGVARVKCRVKGDVKGMDLSFVCSAPTRGDWDEDFEVTQSLGEVVRGRTPNVIIEIRNNSKRSKEIGANSVVGEICSVGAVIPVPVAKMAVDVASVQEGEGGSPEGVGRDDHVAANGNDVAKNTGPSGDSGMWQPKANLDHLPPDQKAQVEKLLWDECELFAKNDTDIGLIPDLQMEINLTDEIPVNEAYRHLPRKLYEDVKTYLNDLIINGWIKESKSSYASPVVCVRKKDGSMRLCVDYRKLNQKTIADRHPIPRVQDLLDGLHGQKYFTTLDMAKAYHQGFIKEDCRKYTAFATPWALYEWLRIPFGLKNAPAAFQRYISQSLTGLLDRACLAYLDDILVYGRTFEEHLDHLKKVFRRLRSKGVKLRVNKCFFVMGEVRYLGRLVSKDGYRPDPEDIRALEKFRVPPKNVGEVRTMVGFLSYYRGHVSNFAKRMKPVYDLIKWKGEVSPTKTGKSSAKSGYDKKRSVLWSDELQKLVDGVIDTLKSPQVMAYPDYGQPFVLNCDASGYGLGAVLYQRQDEKMRVISYASRTLTDAEKNYHLHSGKLEFLALKWSVTTKFSDYLGHGSSFTVYTDCNPLTYVMTTAKLNATGMRWVGELSEYDFVLKYRPGKHSQDADGLSRNPLPCSSDESPPIEVLEKECTETVSREDLSVVLSPPDSFGCMSVDIKTLDLTSVIDMTSAPPLKDISKSELGELQSKDSVVGPVYTAMATGQRPTRRELIKFSRKSRLLVQQWNKLCIKDGVLLRKTARHTQIVLPEHFHLTVFNELHVEMGHLGSERVEALARQRFYWPHMSSEIDYFIRKKCSCLMKKKPPSQEKAKLVPIPASYPFEIVSVDFLHLDKCAGGFEYVLVVCDHFTRFCQAYATKSQTSYAAARKLFDNFILQYGFPKRIHHDQGGHFNSKLFDHLHKMANIKVSNTTPYHPMGDPVVERYNRTLCNMLKAIPESEKKRWKDHLPKLTFAYNSTVHKATGYSPFYLLMGRESRLRIDGAFPSFEDTAKSELSVTYKQYVGNWQRKMNEAFALANRGTEKSQQYNKKQYDSRARSVDIEVGDRVLVQNCRKLWEFKEGKKKTGTGKLASFWEQNVYVVVGKRANLPVYEVRRHGSPTSQVRVVHRNLLKLVNELRPPEDSVVSPGIGSSTNSAQSRSFKIKFCSVKTQV